MTYIITNPCVGICDTAYIGVCPVDCIHGPVDAIYDEDEVLDEHELSIDKNYFFLVKKYKLIIL